MFLPIKTCVVSFINPVYFGYCIKNTLDYNLTLSSEITFCIHVKAKTAYIFSLSVSLYFLYISQNGKNIIETRPEAKYASYFYHYTASFSEDNPFSLFKFCSVKGLYYLLWDNT